LIFLWIVDELNFDKFHKNIDQLYSIYEHQEYSEGQELFTGCTPFPLSQKLANDYDEVVCATTHSFMGNFPLKYDNMEFIEGPCIITDKEFLNVFSFPIIEGDANALSSPDKMIITQQIADMFFKGESALGKKIKVYGNTEFEVGAIIAPPEKNSTIDFKVLLPLEFVSQNGWTQLDSWGNNWPRTTALLANNTDSHDFQNKITNLCKDNGQENTTLHVFPFKKERLYSYSGEKNRVQYIYQFLAIAFIIILIASINFINFSTARAEKRKPEVGIRKALGATKLNITKQFILEKGIMVIISLMVSVILVALFLPLFGRLADKTIELSLLQNKYLIIMLLIVVVTTISLSVTYPALYMASFAPARVLKKQAKAKSGIFSFRSLLVVIQFALSIGLIICSIFISNQLKFISNYDLGYNKENLIFLDLPGSAKAKHRVLSQEFDKIEGISSYTKADKIPFYGGNSSWGYNWEGKDPEKKVLICLMQVDRNYFSTLGIDFAEGQEFSERFNNWENDTTLEYNEVVLNQEAIRRMGLENPLGKSFGRNGGNQASIVGVIKNFNFENLRQGIEPLLLRPLNGEPNNIILRIRPDNFYNTVSEIKSIWAKVYPQTPCEIGFFDERLKQMYNSELKISGLFKSFTLIAIFIACIGLFGLSLYAIEIRRKEIGIRKVNGSTRTEIITLLNKDFVLRVLIAFVIACPLSYYIMSKWLENFAYKTTLSWWVFVLSGFIALGIAVLTISWQSWKAATRNPVEALRYE